MDYAKAFRVIRAAFGLSQAQLAALIRVGPSQISLIESGKRQPSLATITDLAAALDIPRSLIDLLASDKAELDRQDQDIVAALARNLLRLLVEARSESGQHRFRYPK